MRQHSLSAQEETRLVFRTSCVFLWRRDFMDIRLVVLTGACSARETYSGVGVTGGRGEGGVGTGA